MEREKYQNPFLMKSGKIQASFSPYSVSQCFAPGSSHGCCVLRDKPISTCGGSEAMLSRLEQ
jgi:hypothetical protein